MTPHAPALAAYKLRIGFTGMPWEMKESDLDAAFMAGVEAGRSEPAGILPPKVMEGHFLGLAANNDPIPRITAEDIYASWPVKKARGAAIKAIQKAMKQEKPERLLAAVNELSDCYKQWPVAERQYLPMAATFFNQERWADDRSTWRKGAAAAPSQFSRAAH
jgi:hypothetical protein